jgi:hypothetical protein
MADFYTILTNTGRSKLAAAQAAGTAVQLSHMALGDGGGSYHTPDPTQTALVNERYRNALNSVAVDPQNEFWLVCELVVPSATGGFYIREVGVFDVDGDLIAVGKYPETYKPTLADGVAKDLHIKMIFETSNAASVSISVDPSVILASRDYVDEHAAVNATETTSGHIELATVAEAQAGTDTERAVTPAGLAAALSEIDLTGYVQSSEFTQSLGESGWQRLPSGLILQWGTGSVSTGVATEVTLPIAYPNAQLSCVAVIGIDYGSAGNDAIAVYNRMAGKFTLKGEHSGSTVMPYSYISIGY